MDTADTKVNQIWSLSPKTLHVKKYENDLGMISSTVINDYILILNAHYLFSGMIFPMF